MNLGRIDVIMLKRMSPVNEERVPIFDKIGRFDLFENIGY